MNKRSVLMLILCCLPLQLNASSYVGGNLGVNAIHIKKNLFYPLDELLPTSASLRHGYTGFHGQLFGGYDFSLSTKTAIAVEANATAFTGKAQHRIDRWFFAENVHAKEKLNYDFALFILPEYQYNPNLRFFIGPGISRGKFTINFDNSAGNIGVSDHCSRWLTGWPLKLGTANKLSENTEMLLSYQYVEYRAASWTKAEPLTGDSLRAVYKPSANLFTAGLRISLPNS